MHLSCTAPQVLEHRANLRILLHLHPHGPKGGFASAGLRSAVPFSRLELCSCSSFTPSQGESWRVEVVIGNKDPSVSVLSLLSKTCCLLRFVLCPAGTWELHLCCCHRLLPRGVWLMQVHPKLCLQLLLSFRHCL